MAAAKLGCVLGSVAVGGLMRSTMGGDKTAPESGGGGPTIWADSASESSGLDENWCNRRFPMRRSRISQSGPLAGPVGQILSGPRNPGRCIGCTDACPSPGRVKPSLARLSGDPPPRTLTPLSRPPFEGTQPDRSAGVGCACQLLFAAQTAPGAPSVALAFDVRRASPRRRHGRLHHVLLLPPCLLDIRLSPILPRSRPRSAEAPQKARGAWRWVQTTCGDRGLADFPIRISAAAARNALEAHSASAVGRSCQAIASYPCDGERLALKGIRRSDFKIGLRRPR